MALVIACGESSPSHIALLRCLNRTLDSIKHNIARIFVNILCCQADSDANARGKDLLPTTFEDFMKNWNENYHLSAQHWFSKKNNSDGEQDPHAVFNALDAMLKDSLERLKTMRESISMTEIGFISCTSKVNCMDHVGIIRVLCMDEKSMVPEPLLWNCIIDCYGRYGDLSTALSVKDRMLASGVQPNVYTYNALIHAQVKGGNIDRGLVLKKEMLMSGLCPDVVTYNLLIGAACKLGHIYFAFRLHDEMLRIGFDPDIFTYAALIRGHCMRGNMKEAEELFTKMRESGLPIDHVPYQMLFKK